VGAKGEGEDWAMEGEGGEVGGCDGSICEAL